MKKVIMLLAVVCTVNSLAVRAESIATFSGKKFSATIEEQCAEANLSCDKVWLTSTSLKTHQSIKLKGETINVNCPDVCDFRGYRFTNGDYEYAFYPGGKDISSWDYIITKNDRVIAQDHGVMK
ncbi:hypothetical protein [Pantoea wallisii]|nr:hypothetical protein [Pantoea wallisii]